MSIIRVPVSIGDKYNKWTILKEVDPIYKKKTRAFLCRCECGNEKIVALSSLRGSKPMSKSCGCVPGMLRHGMYQDPFYKIWTAINQRCYNPEAEGYERYGGRGIKVCEKWRIFDGFKEDMYDGYVTHVKEFGRKNTSVDRMDNSKDYSPENCWWATRAEQLRNTRRNVFLELNGKKQTIKDWSDELGIKYETIRSRLRVGYSIPDALGI